MSFTKGIVMDEELLREIGRKMDTLILLIGSNVGPELSVADRAPLLSRAGLDRNAIAAICNTTPAAVSVRLAEAKRKPSKRATSKRR